jgi:hypothetical protein
MIGVTKDTLTVFVNSNAGISAWCSDRLKDLNNSIACPGSAQRASTAKGPWSKLCCEISISFRVRDRGGLQVFETLRTPHFLECRLTGDGEVVSLTR